MTEQTKTSSQASTTITVKMDDGKMVEFSGKRKLVKTSTIDEATGEVIIRLDFSNGEYRVYNVVPKLMAKFAAHGAEQKIGDEIAGVQDVEDCVAAIDELLIRLEKGEWNLKREAGGLSGASILAKAMIEMTGKSKTDIATFLASKSHAEKIALRTNKRLVPIIQRLEAEKASRSKGGKTVVDSDALLDSLEAPAAHAGHTHGHQHHAAEMAAAE